METETWMSPELENDVVEAVRNVMRQESNIPNYVGGFCMDPSWCGFDVDDLTEFSVALVVVVL